MEERIDAKTEEIRSALRRMGKRMKLGDDSEILHWVLPDALVCGQRPLRHHALYGGSGRNIEPEAAPLVKDWAARVQAVGILSIISLMHARDIGYYEGST